MISGPPALPPEPQPPTCTFIVFFLLQLQNLKFCRNLGQRCTLTTEFKPVAEQKALFVLLSFTYSVAFDLQVSGANLIQSVSIHLTLLNRKCPVSYLPAEGGQLPVHSQCFLHPTAALHCTGSPLQRPDQCRTSQPAPPADRKRTMEVNQGSDIYITILIYLNDITINNRHVN